MPLTFEQGSHLPDSACAIRDTLRRRRRVLPSVCHCQRSAKFRLYSELPHSSLAKGNLIKDLQRCRSFFMPLTFEQGSHLPDRACAIRDMLRRRRRVPPSVCHCQRSAKFRLYSELPQLAPVQSEIFTFKV